MSKALAMAALLCLPSAAMADGWATAMTPVDPRPPLPKPVEPDAGNDNDGPFHAPAPPPVPVPPREKPAPPARPSAIDPRLTRDANGVYFGTAPDGQVYYSTNPDDVIRAIVPDSMKNLPPVARN